MDQQPTTSGSALHQHINPLLRGMEHGDREDDRKRPAIDASLSSRTASVTASLTAATSSNFSFFASSSTSISATGNPQQPDVDLRDSLIRPSHHSKQKKKKKKSVQRASSSTGVNTTGISTGIKAEGLDMKKKKKNSKSK
jgi:hypothetical protein